MAWIKLCSIRLILNSFQWSDNQPWITWFFYRVAGMSYTNTQIIHAPHNVTQIILMTHCFSQTQRDIDTHPDTDKHPVTDTHIYHLDNFNDPLFSVFSQTQWDIGTHPDTDKHPVTDTHIYHQDNFNDPLFSVFSQTQSQILTLPSPLECT